MGVRGIRKEEFLLLFLELVNMFALHGGFFWSKLNAEFALFYFWLFHYWFCSLKPCHSSFTVPAPVRTPAGRTGDSYLVSLTSRLHLNMTKFIFIHGTSNDRPPHEVP